MFEGQRSAASIGIESGRARRIDAEAGLCDPDLAKASRYHSIASSLPQVELEAPSGPRGRNDEHRRREGYGRRRHNVARAAGSDFQCGRGEQPVTANRTGTDFTQENLGAGYPRRAYYSTNEMQAPAHPLAFVARQKKTLRQGFAAAPHIFVARQKRHCGKDWPQRLSRRHKSGTGSGFGIGIVPKTAMHPCNALKPQTVLLKGAVVLPPVALTGTNAAVTVEPRPAPDQVAVECDLRVVAPVNPMKMFWSCMPVLASVIP